MDFSELLHGFGKFTTWICFSFYLDFLKLFLGFVRGVLGISCPLPNKTKVKFDQHFKAGLSFYFELTVLSESKYSMFWVRCAFGNVFTENGKGLLKTVCIRHFPA